MVSTFCLLRRAGCPLGWAGAGGLLLALLPSCKVGDPSMPRPDGGRNPIIDGGFVCLDLDSEACLDGVHYRCESDGEFLRPVRDNCAERGLICVDGLWCVVCRPNSGGCDAQGNAVVCRADGSGWDLRDECDIANGEVCDLGECRNLCQRALDQRSYVGCEFYAVDLDNAAIGAGRDASSQQYAIVVSNPSNYPTDVVVEEDLGTFNGPTMPRVVARTRVLPGDLETILLPRREVDGSSFFSPCTSDEMCGSATQRCFCSGGLRPTDVGARDCRCRSSATGSGMNDGTHSALTAHAYRVRSGLPIVAYQFNPLDNVGVFSNDASLLLPTSGIGRRYTVVGWPQTIANSEIASEDFDPSRSDEDLRAFLTIVGTEERTHVTITLGPQVRNVVGVGGYPNGMPGDVWEFDLGDFDVINLETQGFNADFTGTIIEARPHPVAVFVGSEASDAPRFSDLANRQCCADHLEEQLFPDDVLGRRFFIGRTPPRSHALNRAFLDPSRDSVGMFNEPEYVRIVAVEEGTTLVRTSAPFPDDSFELARGESVIIEALQDMEINADRAIAVLQVLASQDAVGIPFDYPGGDPAIIAVPPVNQWRTEYVFLTPDLYAFDFVTIVARRETAILLDERPLHEFECDVGPADGIVRSMDDPPPDYVVYRCQLSFPDVIGRPNVRVEPGLQDDGYHTIRATEEVSVVISGFDAYVSYAYVGGADLEAVM
jgi:hypothetical protein